MRSVPSLTLFSLVFLAQQASASLMGADVLLRGGTAYSMDTQGNRHSAITIAGDQILAIGSEADVSLFTIEATRIVELDGRVVFPGFIDTHIHPMDTLPLLNGAMLSPGQSAEEVLEATIGTLEPGKKADLVALDGDPYLSDPYAIHSIEVDLTLSNGRLVYEKKY